MLYLLAASWEWLAGAAAIGFAVGLYAFSNEKDARFSGYGIVVIAALLLLGGFFCCNLQIVPGRAGLFVDLGLLLASAYALALPVGGGVRLLTSAAAFPAAPAKKKPPHVVLRGAPKPAPAEPAEAAEPQPESEPERRPEELEEEAPPAASSTPAPPKAAPVETPKKHPGVQPPGLPGPREGKPDDLSKIKGVGPKSVEKLHGLGVYHFDQIAAWTPEHVKWVSASFAIPGRLEKGRWVAQAKDLAEAAEAKAGETP